MISSLKRLWRDRRGNSLAIAGAALPLILGSAGLASDTIQWTPGVDSLLDSLRAPVETIPPALAEPAESLIPGQSTSLSGMTSAR
jgi:hypothetical protein